MIRCQAEVQPDGEIVVHVRFNLDGRSAGVLTLKMQEWVLIHDSLHKIFDYSEKLITED